MRPDQSTALHASLLSLTMSDGELSDDDALTLHTNAVEAEDMHAAEAAKVEPAALYCSHSHAGSYRLSRRCCFPTSSLVE
jgi:hypothetical protein